MKELSLKYIVKQPDVSTPGRRPPLLVLLHGIGSNEQDLMGLASLVDPRFLIVSVRAPITMQPGSYAWYPTQFLPTGFVIDEDVAEQNRRVLLKFVDDVTEAVQADPERVFLMGFSQGCIMGVAAGLTAPRKFAGIVGMSGRLLPGLESRIAPEQELRGLPVLIVHGTADNVIRISFGRELRDRLRALGVDLEYIEYPMAHHVSDESLERVRGWLAARLDAQRDWRSKAAQ
jgi:phospholipase/carboxylesterase